MIKRTCPKCVKKSISIPFISNTFVCRECASTFKVSGLVLALESLVGALLGTASFYFIIFSSNWLVSLILVLGFVFTAHWGFNRFGQLKLAGIKGYRRAKNS
jgi:hypothetical protein